MTESPKYPDVHVPLTGEDGNAVLIVGRVSKALRRAGVSDREAAAFRRKALHGDYDHALATCQRWVSVS